MNCKVSWNYVKRNIFLCKPFVSAHMIHKICWFSKIGCSILTEVLVINERKDEGRQNYFLKGLTSILTENCSKPSQTECQRKYRFVQYFNYCWMHSQTLLSKSESGTVKCEQIFLHISTFRDWKSVVVWLKGCAIEVCVLNGNLI